MYLSMMSLQFHPCLMDYTMNDLYRGILYNILQPKNLLKQHHSSSILKEQWLIERLLLAWLRSSTCSQFKTFHFNWIGKIFMLTDIFQPNLTFFFHIINKTPIYCMQWSLFSYNNRFHNMTIKMQCTVYTYNASQFIKARYRPTW